MQYWFGVGVGTRQFQWSVATMMAGLVLMPEDIIFKK